MKRPLTPEELKKKRLEAANDLIRRVQSGEVPSGNSLDTWFPPRPVTPKDLKAVREIFGGGDSPRSEPRNTTQGKENK